VKTLEKEKSCEKTAHGLAGGGGEHIEIYKQIFMIERPLDIIMQTLQKISSKNNKQAEQ